MQQLGEKTLKGVTTDLFDGGEELQRAVDYYRAQAVARGLLADGIITEGQYNRLNELDFLEFAPRFESMLASMNGTK